MKTAEQEELEGNPGHRKKNANPPVKILKIPEPTKDLCPIAVRYYHELVRRFGPEGSQVLAATDADMLCIMSKAYALCRGAYETLKTFKDGCVDGPSGKRVHQALKVIESREPVLVRGLKDFGGTPVDRPKIQRVDTVTTELSREEKNSKRRALAQENAKKLAIAGKHIKKAVNV